MTQTTRPHGSHLLLDMYGCSVNATCTHHALDTLCGAADAAGVHVLKTGIHDFGRDLGITVFALLAESHISLHSWPEHGYIAADIFTCGSGDCKAAARMLINTYQPDHCEQRFITRGDQFS